MNEDTAAKWALRLLIGYVAVAVLCFGPATVQSEKAKQQHDAACAAEHGADQQQRALCRLGGPMMADGAPKAMLWPLWLSYTITRSFWA